MKRSHRSARRRVGAALGTVTIALWTLAGQASAHVEADPASVAAGSTDTITFNVEHGCGDSATVKLEMKLAEGVSDVKPGAIDGWTSSQSGGVITWTGGPQPHDKPLDVSVEMTFPNTSGATLLFPLVQTCQQGETRWVDPPNPDGSEAEDPAPLVKLTASTGASTTATTLAAATTGATASTDPVATTAAAPATTISTDEGSDNTALVIAAVAVGIVVVVGAGAWLLARMNRS